MWFEILIWHFFFDDEPARPTAAGWKAVLDFSRMFKWPVRLCV